MILKFILSTVFVSIFSTTVAQSDSLSASSLSLFSQKPKQDKVTRLINHPTFKMLSAPVLLSGVGFAYIAFDDKFKYTKDNFIPNFDRSYDDYTQYLPAAVMLGLKATNAHGGGKSSWGKMFTADAFSALIMTGVVNTIKYTAKVSRPGNGAKNSFPSGHTATAFLTAAMLHKEYGDVSRWYSVGAYTMATATGVTRLFNDKHWVSDVFVGATIGILSVELGYLIADKIFKKEKKVFSLDDYVSFGHGDKPSFIGLYTGVDTNLSSYTSSNGSDINYLSGSKFGVEGAWFLNSYVGVGGLVTATSSSLEIGGKEEAVLNTISSAVGLYLSYPLGSVVRVGTKALFGAKYIYDYNLSHEKLDINPYTMNMMTGLSISYLANQDLSFNLFADYSLAPQFIMKTASNELTCGISINVIL